MWVKRHKDWISEHPVVDGVWRRRDGGFHIRGRARDPKTGRLREIERSLPDCKRDRDAAAILIAELDKIRAGGVTRAIRYPTFGEWAVTVFDRKVKAGNIKSRSGRDKWDQSIRLHLLPAFGPIYIDQLTREDVETWRTEVLLAEREFTADTKRKRRLRDGKYSPQTVNTIIGVLRQITLEASEAFHIADVCRTIDNADARGHRTYTYESPNSIKPADVPEFLGLVRLAYPKHYAMVFLGITTGLRPSSMRPLRRKGPFADVKWEDGKLLVRRSQTRGNEVMGFTKTDLDQVLDLDPEQLSVLRWHCDRLDRRIAKLREKPETLAIAEALEASDLLFPASPTRWSKGGGFRSRSCLDEMFKDIGERMKLGYRISPRAMRRTFDDLARAAKVKDLVARAIGGWRTREMQDHYATVGSDEVRGALAAVIDIATGRKRAA